MLDRMFLPRGHDNNIAPRLVERNAEHFGYAAQPVRDWSLGTVFHVGYGMGWGVLMGVAQQRLRLPWPLLGTLAGALIYTAAFSRIGAGTLTGTEKPPEERPWRKQVSLVTVALTFAFVEAALLALWRHLRSAPAEAAEQSPDPAEDALPDVGEVEVAEHDARGVCAGGPMDAPARVG